MMPGDDAPPAVPWYLRYTRWRPTSKIESIFHEEQLYKKLISPSAGLKVEDVFIGPKKEDYLHTVSAGSASSSPPVVVLPGYGAGVGFFFRNFEGLASRMRLLCVDWLGTGLSGRPPYKARTTEEAEAFFIDSLAEWRRVQGLGKMVLVGHSLGGYLAAAYALKHPDHVEHLVLVCPAGVPKMDKDWEEKLLGKGWSFRGQLFRTFMWLWEKGVTPGSFVRFLGPLGPGLVTKYVSSRFQHHGEGLTPQEVEVFRHYFYHIAAAPGSGEYALRHLLAPGAFAYAPLEGRLHDLKVPLTFIYGQHDWMRPGHAVRVCQQLRAERPTRGPNDLQVQTIHDAGHYPMIDQPELFNKALCAVVAPYLERQGAPSAARTYSADHTATATTGGGAEVSWGFAADAAAATAASSRAGAAAGVQ